MTEFTLTWQMKISVKNSVTELDLGKNNRILVKVSRKLILEGSTLEFSACMHAYGIKKKKKKKSKLPNLIYINLLM